MTTLAIFYVHKLAQGNELRYLLRSLANVQGEFSTVVVGDPPSWYNGPLIYYQHIENQHHQNVCKKYDLVLSSPLVTEQFSMVMDDTVFLKKTNVETLKTWFSNGPIKKEHTGKSGYQKVVGHTARRCYERGLRPNKVNTHFPWSLEKKKLAETLQTFGTHENFLFEIGYAAQWAVPVVPIDPKVFQFITRKGKPTWNSQVLNYNRLSPELEYGLRKILSSKSQYESDEGKLEPYKIQADNYNRDFPCVHLGGVKKVVQGQFSKKPEMVRYCSLLGECTIKRIDNIDRPRCIACKHYKGLPKENYQIK